jgi:excisionase family DNA binding protein
MSWKIDVDVNALPFSLRVEHIAGLLGISQTAAYSAISKGKIPTAKKVGGTWIANRDRVLEWLRGEDRKRR